MKLDKNTRLEDIDSILLKKLVQVAYDDVIKRQILPLALYKHLITRTSVDSSDFFAEFATRFTSNLSWFTETDRRKKEIFLGVYSHLRQLKVYKSEEWAFAVRFNTDVDLITVSIPRLLKRTLSRSSCF